MGIGLATRVLPKYEIEAAFLRLEPTLKTLKRGDNITDQWCEETSQLKPFYNDNGTHRLEQRIKTYFFNRREGIVVRRKGNKLHLCTASGQKEEGAKHEVRAKKQHIRTFKVNRAIPRDELATDAERREVDHRQEKALVHLDAMERSAKELKAIVGAPEALPPRRDK